MSDRCAARVGALACTALLTACTAVEASVHEPVPAVQIAAGPDASAPKTLTLTPDAVRRLEVQTAVVADAGEIPYSGVVYDKKGAPWVYASPRDRTYVRVPVTIEEVASDTARVSEGPGVGTVVVTRAAIKLYGAETGVGGGH